MKKRSADPPPPSPALPDAAARVGPSAPPAGAPRHDVPRGVEQRCAHPAMLHGPGVASHVYAQQIKVVANDPELQQTAFGHAADVLRRLDCHDPLEEMLAMQALWAHGRVARLSALANNQSSRDNLRVINDAC